MIEVDIIGTCVSRDPFNFDKKNFSVNYYSSRSSLVSMVQKPVNLPMQVPQFDSNFLNRAITEDFTKRFQRYSNSPKTEVIIIDLIQERYPLNYSRDKGFLTYSPEYSRTKLEKGILLDGEAHYRQFERFIKKISRLFSRYKIVILHEANLAKEYYSINGDIKEYDLKDRDRYFINNGSKYYELLKKHINNIYSLRIDGFIGDENHRWGNGPAHFEEGYYYKFLEGLDYIIKQEKDFYYSKNNGKNI